MPAKKKDRTRICPKCKKVFYLKLDGRIRFCSIGCAIRNNITWEMNGDCMECTSHKAGNHGYPTVYRNKKHWSIHRYIYFMKHGEIPEGKVIRHSCDNRLCINADHLLIGTHQDNVNDKIRRNRHAKGEKIGTSKLTDEEVLEIREIGRSKTLKEMVSIYKVSDATISRILTNQTWQHLLLIKSTKES